MFILLRDKEETILNMNRVESVYRTDTDRIMYVVTGLRHSADYDSEHQCSEDYETIKRMVL